MVDRSREDIAALIEQLQHGPWDSPPTVAQALGSLGVREAIPALIEQLWKGPYPPTDIARSQQAKAPFIDALKKLWTRDDIDTLRDLLIDANEPGPQLVAIDAVTQLGAREAIPHLYYVVQHSNMEVCSAAAAALEKLEANELAPLVMRHLAEPQGAYRVGAAIVAGALRLEEAKPYLLQLLWDKTLYFLSTWAIMDALTGLWTRDDWQTLVDLERGHWDGDVREKAAKILDKL